MCMAQKEMRGLARISLFFLSCRLLLQLLLVSSPFNCRAEMRNVVVVVKKKKVEAKVCFCNLVVSSGAEVH